MNSKPTMNDVAELAQVALGTVSKVLNGDTSVRPDRRDRVLAACEKLNYKRNALAASLRSRQSHTVGILIPDILNTFYATLVEKLENLASDAGYTVMVVTTGESGQRAQSRIEILRQRQVDGIIVIPPLDSSLSLTAIDTPDVPPCVIVDRIAENDPYPSVATDNIKAVYQGTRHLLSLGHRHITLAINSPRLWNTHERIQGFQQAMAEENARADVRIVGMTVEEARISLLDLFSSAECPTALLTSNNLVTLGAISAQQESGLRIPDDLSLLAFDDFEWLRLVQPQVSAIRQPIDQIANEAWRLLAYQIGGKPMDVRHVRADTELMIRQSTGAPHSTSWKVEVL